jgi:hypothetical protein
MRNKLIIILMFALVPVLAGAEPPTIRPDHPETYTVVKGDTLWDISGRFLEQPWRWPDIWEANPQIENPHLIYPGDVIRLTWRDGRPILMVDRDRAMAEDERYVRLSPEVRIDDRPDPIPVIPVEAIRPFLNQPLVLDQDEMEGWPYVVSSYDQRLISASGNTIYVRGLPENESRRYSIYRRGPAYRAVGDDRYEDGQILGYEALYVGDAVIDRPGDPAAAVITRSDREVLVGDRLFPYDEGEAINEFMPRAPATEVQGNVISVIDGVSEIGQYQVVVLSVGAADGIENGNVLGVYQSGPVVRDHLAGRMRDKAGEEDRLRFEYEDDSPVDNLLSNIFNDIRNTKRALDRRMGYFGQSQAKPEEVQMPEEFAGIIMVFRTFDKVSYALVMETDAPIHIKDVVRNL